MPSYAMGSGPVCDPVDSDPSHLAEAGVWLNCLSNPGRVGTDGLTRVNLPTHCER